MASGRVAKRRSNPLTTPTLSAACAASRILPAAFTAPLASASSMLAVRYRLFLSCLQDEQQGWACVVYAPAEELLNCNILHCDAWVIDCHDSMAMMQAFIHVDHVQIGSQAAGLHLGL